MFQIAALFVVSRRTEHEYAQCLLSLVRLVRSLFGKLLRVDAVMGDAEDAQLNAVESVASFGHPKILMCFFHVLYNVRKMTRHFDGSTRKIVMRGIMQMHLSKNLHSFEETKRKVLEEWNGTEGVRDFAKYFNEQWLQGRYWRWQIFHTPFGYATTNNPCETFNAKIKKFTQRSRFHMRKLLQRLMALLRMCPVLKPVASGTVLPPTAELKKASRLLVSSNLLEFTPSQEPSIAYVRQRRATEVQSTATNAGQMSESFCDDPFSTEGIPSQDTDDANTGENETDGGVNTWEGSVLCREERVAAAKLYSSVVKWSFHQAHTVGMPEYGWTVDFVTCKCDCLYFAKYAMCAHVIGARMINNLGMPGQDKSKGKPKKLKNRSLSKATSAKKRRIQGDSRIVHENDVVIGRPAHATPALQLQYVTPVASTPSHVEIVEADQDQDQEPIAPRQHGRGSLGFVLN